MLLAAMASWTGGWNSTWWLTVFFAALGSLLIFQLSLKNWPFASSR